MNVDQDRIQARLVAIQELLAHLESLGPVSAERLEGDFGTRLQVERALTQIVTLSTEINSHVAARELRRAPSDLRESFNDLVRAGWLSRELAARLRDSPGLRNVLVHEYVKVDLEIVAAAVPATIEGFGEYVRTLAARL